MPISSHKDVREELKSKVQPQDEEVLLGTSGTKERARAQEKEVIANTVPGGGKERKEKKMSWGLSGPTNYYIARGR